MEENKVKELPTVKENQIDWAEKAKHGVFYLW